MFTRSKQSLDVDDDAIELEADGTHATIADDEDNVDMGYERMYRRSNETEHCFGALLCSKKGLLKSKSENN